MGFQPDYHNIQDAAYNLQPRRLPLYEHSVHPVVMEKVMGVELIPLFQKDKDEYYKRYCAFFHEMGYDTVSFECCIGPAMPGSGALGSNKDGVIKERKDFQEYPWTEIPDFYFEMYRADFEALRRQMPEGMKAVGGVGNGIFECVQDVVGYEELCYIRQDDPELYADLFQKVGQTNRKIWNRFLEEFGDIFCVCRFGDDLGFKSTTLLPPDDIREHILPLYKEIIDLVHQAGKPFLLHSCGCIFNVMEDILAVGINAKHSNEDQIAPFQEWVNRYGDRIGNFGGIDTDAVCRLPTREMIDYIENVIGQAQGHGGFAFGSGNSIPDYVPPEQYLTMIRIVREIRGE